MSPMDGRGGRKGFVDLVAGKICTSTSSGSSQRNITRGRDDDVRVLLLALHTYFYVSVTEIYLPVGTSR